MAHISVKMMTRRMLRKTERKRKRMDKETAEKERSVKLDEQGIWEELLPGIPNDVTSQVMSLGLPWRTIYTLSLVSRAWKHTIQSREIFDARNRNHSTEALAVINHTVSEGTNAIGLYSLKDKACYQAPPIPHVECGIPRSCECITLDGKIYLLGGVKKSNLRHGSAKVWVLDLAGQRQWKRCANMHEPRYRFGCGVFHGKIYVFGGTSLRVPVLGSEVYDPKTDEWTAIQPMPRPWQLGHEVGTVGHELLVYSGRLRYFELYNPITDSWRRPATSFKRHPAERWFVADGKLYSMTRSGIFVIDIEKDSRTRVHAYSYAIEGLFTNFRDQPEARPEAVLADTILAVDDELLAKCDWQEWSLGGTQVSFVIGLLQSRGFSTKDNVVVWQRAHAPLSFVGLASPFMRQLRL